MNRRTGVPAQAAAEQKTVKKTVDALVNDLVIRGADLRTVSLEDMKRSLAAVLKTRRSKAAALAAVAAAV